MYRIQSITLLLALVALYAGLGYLLFGLGGAILILLAGLVLNGLSLGSAPRMILSLHRARPLGYREAPAVLDQVRSLSARAGIDMPFVAVYPSEVPNAFAISGVGQSSTVALSSGLLRNLSLREINGVIAHELSHLKNRDTLLSLAAGLFVQGIAGIANTFGFLLLMLFLVGAWPQTGVGLLTTALLVGPAPYAAYAIHAALTRTRERLADRDAALLTGDPRGLASALHRLEQLNRYLAGIYRRFRFIYTTEMEKGPRWLCTHPPTEERIEALLGMEDKIAAHPALERPSAIVAQPSTRYLFG